MLTGSLKDRANDESSVLGRAFAYLKRQDENSFSQGRFELSDLMFAFHSEYETKDPKTCRFEAHRKYIDLQFLLAGQECIKVKDAKLLTPNNDYEDDIEFFKDEVLGETTTSILLQAGDFVLLLPRDAHAPGCMQNAPSLVKKIVIKIPVTLLSEGDLA